MKYSLMFREMTKVSFVISCRADLSTSWPESFVQMIMWDLKLKSLKPKIQAFLASQPVQGVPIEITFLLGSYKDNGPEIQIGWTADSPQRILVTVF